MINTYYCNKQNADQVGQPDNFPTSPSARKPQRLAQELAKHRLAFFYEPEPLTVEDFELCHDPVYVRGIMACRYINGFGTKSEEVAASLPYTNGAMYSALCDATPTKPTCALVSGFHHAGYYGWRGLGYFCTINGLMVAAAKFQAAGKKIAIIDCDQHWGNGTDDILNKLPHLQASTLHITFGKHFQNPTHAQQYLEWLAPDGYVSRALAEFKPDAIIYQAGVDVHVDDPYGGILTSNEIRIRDHLMFSIAKKLEIPLTWNLAGGYQVAEDGSIQKVLDLHMNTFTEALLVY